MKWKKIILAVAMLLCFALSGCLRMTLDVEPKQREDGYPTWSFDTLLPHTDEEFGMEDWVRELDFELKYDGITATVADAELPCDARRIEITVSNSSGKAFYCYQLPALEYNNGGEWIKLYTGRISYYHEYVFQDGWNFVLPDDPESQKLEIDLDIACFNPALETGDGAVGELIPGEYRIVVFTPVSDICIPITFTEPAGRSNEDPVWSYDSLTPQDSDTRMQKYEERFSLYSGELDYGSVSAVLARDEVSCGAETIEISVDNSDGLVFWVWSLPYIEYKNGEEWVRMLIEPAEDAFVGWTYVIPENGGCSVLLELPLSRAEFDLPLQTENGSVEKAVPGQYRIVIFTPVGRIYVPLTLTE